MLGGLTFGAKPIVGLPQYLQLAMMIGSPQSAMANMQ